MIFDPDDAGFRTHSIECRCIDCARKRAAARSSPAYLGDVEHKHTASVPEIGDSIYIDGHDVQFAGDWSDD